MVEESPQSQTQKPKAKMKLNKFIVGGALIFIAVILLVITSIKGNAQYYMTINELKSSPDKWGQAVRISGVVLGDTISLDPKSDEISFQVVNIPGDMKTIEDMGGIAAVLHLAATDPTAQPLTIFYHGVKPDLLKDEAQAIMTGKMQGDGSFLADELLLKCPSKYQEAPLN